MEIFNLQCILRLLMIYYIKIHFVNITWLQIHAAAAAAKSLQSCLTLCDPTDSIPPGSPVPGILQARTLEWVAVSFSNAWKWKVKVKSLSHVWLLATPWTAAHQAPPSMGFSRQEYWSGVPYYLLQNCKTHATFLCYFNDCIKSLGNMWSYIYKYRIAAN